MSILEGFAMLNNSIRNIRTDRAQHEQRMAGLELEKNKLEAQMNDPRRQLDRLKASREMQNVPINFTIGKFDNDKERQFFNMYTRDAIIDTLRQEDLEMDENGRITEIGSTEPAVRPRYAAKAIANKLALINQASRLGHSELDFEIDTLQQDINNSPKGTTGPNGSAREKLLAAQRKIKLDKLATLVEKRKDPKEQLNRLTETSSRIFDMQLSAMSDPNIGNEVYAKLGNMQTSVNNQMKTLIAAGGGTNTKAVTYTYTNPDTGEVVEQVKYLSPYKANTAAQQYVDDLGRVFTKGKTTNAAKMIKGLENNQGGYTTKEWQDINEQFTNKKLKMHAAAVKALGEERVQEILADAADDKEEVERLMQMISTDPDAVKQVWYRDMMKDMELFGKYSNFVGNKAWNNMQGQIDQTGLTLDPSNPDPFGWKQKK